MTGAKDEDFARLDLTRDLTDLNEQVASLVTQQRIIVRTVEIGLVVSDVADAIDEISQLAQELGGWVVNTDRSRRHNGSISIRVPATSLDDAVSRLRDSAVDVEFEISTSRDVTDEFVDTTARLTNLEATEGALLKLLDNAVTVEDALAVQRELTRVQEEIERLQGRIKFLEQTAAFSLINIDLRLEPMDMPVDAGLNQTFSVGQVARFRATFQPPEDIDNFTFTWDFGDGTRQIEASRTAPTVEEGTRITATITHIYDDDRDSPYIVVLKMTGTGDAGLAEGEDTIIATVTRIPTIEVFAGESKNVEEGEEVEFVGSFTRPEGLDDLTFKWDFGDGSAPVTGTIDEGVTNAIATYEYPNHRPFPFTATLTIMAKRNAREVEAENTLTVFVKESEGWVIAGWSANDQGKTAVRALSAVGQSVGTFFIWLGIFSPIWIGLGVVGLVVARRRRSSAS